MERCHKTWGEKWNIFQSDLDEVSYLDLRSWQRCSWHRHQAKYNLFFVVEGEIWIKTTDGISHVRKNEIFTTRPGEWHEFQTHEHPARIIEVMYVKYAAEDIERTEIGGALEKEVKVDFHKVCKECGCSFTSIVLDDALCSLCVDEARNG